jgi:hypothetical protein
MDFDPGHLFSKAKDLYGHETDDFHSSRAWPDESK